MEKPWIGIPTRYHEKSETIGQIRHYLDAILWAGGLPPASSAPETLPSFGPETFGLPAGNEKTASVRRVYKTDKKGKVLSKQPSAYPHTPDDPKYKLKKGSSRFLVGAFHSFGSMQVRIFRRKDSSSRKP